MRVPGTGQSVFGDPTKTGGFGGERHGIGIEAVSMQMHLIDRSESPGLRDISTRKHPQNYLTRK